jgi:ribose-phosphate pyrophosphokinase
VLTLDLHAAQIQGFFDIPVDHLSSGAIFVKHFRSIRDQLGDLVVVSPDVGNLKVAEAYAQILGGDLAVIYKKRISGDTVESSTIMGDVAGKTVLMVDDMISTAGTACEAATLLHGNGARRIIVAATHPVLVGQAIQRIQASPISEIVVTNTIPPGNSKSKALGSRLRVLCVGKLFAEAIDHIHNNKSVSALFSEFAVSKR